jgi:D-mannonate dehydratase
MFTPEEESEIVKKASYAAYHDAIKAAFRTLSDAIAEYLAQHRELYDAEILDVPRNFRPLKDYERTLRIQKLALQMTLQAAERNQHEAANSAATPVPSNGGGRLPVAPVVPTS